MSKEKYAKQILSLLDLTSLNEKDTEEDIVKLCYKARTNVGTPYALCIYPKFINLAKQTLRDLKISHVKVATVVNFPSGSPNIQQTVKETEEAIELGADEIDIVLPYKSIKEDGNINIPTKMVKEVADACYNKALLKVIIESGELQEPHLITMASNIAIDNGANFIKTSTGKVKVNATLQAADLMLNAIYNNNHDVGFKAAGGIKTVDDAIEYIKIAEDIMGKNWISPKTMRFGASSILSDILTTLGISTDISKGDY